MIAPLLKNGAGEVGDRTFSRLSLDVTLSLIIRDGARLSCLKEVLAAPLTSPDDIAERQSVLADFDSHPGLLSELSALSEQLDAIRSAWNEYRRSKLSSPGNPKKSPLRTAEEQCSVSAVTLGKLLFLVRDVKETLEKYRPASAPLRAVLADARSVASGEHFDTLLAVTGELEHRPPASPVDMRITLDALGRIASAELLDRKYMKLPEPAQPRRSWFKKAQEDLPGKPLVPSREEADSLLPLPFSELSRVMDDISKELFGRYSGLGRALLFYSAAVEYIAFLRRHTVPVCYPKFTGGGLSVRGLYDAALLASGVEDVVPHTIASPGGAPGIVVCGANGSGKTTLLRSLLTAHLFAQSGLPVPAEAADFPVYTAFYTQFAEAEREFEAGNDAGRFEQEVRELSRIIERAPSGSLVVLNETFQSTSYDEGSEGLYHILLYFERRGSSYIIATHMEPLRDMLRGNALCLRMNDRCEPVRVE